MRARRATALRPGAAASASLYHVTELRHKIARWQINALERSDMVYSYRLVSERL
jgi:hypothetical protein